MSIGLLLVILGLVVWLVMANPIIGIILIVVGLLYGGFTGSRGRYWY